MWYCNQKKGRLPHLMALEYYCIMCKVGCRPKCPIALMYNKMGEREVRGGMVAYPYTYIPSQVISFQRE